jgi:hypothetical protein
MTLSKDLYLNEKRRTGLFIILFICISVLLGDTVWSSSPLYVDSDYTGTGDGSSRRPFPTIQKAVDVAEDGQLIYIAPGEYQEQVTVRNKDVRLAGASAETVTLRAPGPSPALAFYDVPAGSISGLTITHTYGIGDGIYLYHSAVVIRNSVFRDNQVAIDAREKSYGVFVENCLFRDNEQAVRAERITGTFRNNVLHGQRDTVFELRDSGPVYLYNNLIVHNDSYAVSVKNSRIDMVNNTIADNQAGVEIETTDRTSTVSVRANIIAFNTSYGLRWYITNDDLLNVRHNDLYRNGMDTMRQALLADNISEDPDFMNRAQQGRPGYQLKTGSPCRRYVFRTATGRLSKNDMGYTGDPGAW